MNIVNVGWVITTSSLESADRQLQHFNVLLYLDLIFITLYRELHNTGS